MDKATILFRAVERSASRLLTAMVTKQRATKGLRTRTIGATLVISAMLAGFCSPAYSSILPWLGPDPDMPVWRVQLVLQVCSQGSDYNPPGYEYGPIELDGQQGSDLGGYLRVKLNNWNETILDRPGGDLRTPSRLYGGAYAQTYDLLAIPRSGQCTGGGADSNNGESCTKNADCTGGATCRKVFKVRDIKYLEITNPTIDMIQLCSVALKINGSLVYAHNYYFQDFWESFPVTLFSNPNYGNQRTLQSIATLPPHPTFRVSSGYLLGFNSYLAWLSGRGGWTTPTPPLTISNTWMRELVIAFTATYMNGEAMWRDFPSLSRRNNNTVHIRIPLRREHWTCDADIDINMDFVFECPVCAPAIVVRPRNIDVGGDTAAEVCLLEPLVQNKIDEISKKVASGLRKVLLPIQLPIDAGSLPVNPICPDISVDSAANVHFSIPGSAAEYLEELQEQQGQCREIQALAGELSDALSNLGDQVSSVLERFPTPF